MTPSYASQCCVDLNLFSPSYETVYSYVTAVNSEEFNVNTNVIIDNYHNQGSVLKTWLFLVENVYLHWVVLASKNKL